MHLAQESFGFLVILSIAFGRSSLYNKRHKEEINYKVRRQTIMNLIFLLGVFGAICLTFGVGYLIFIAALYVVYKAAGGKKTFRAWKAAQGY